MDVIQLKIRHKTTDYDNILLNNSFMLRIQEDPSENFLKEGHFACGDHKKNCRCLLLRWTGLFAHYFTKELKLCLGYRKKFITRIKKHFARQIVVKLVDTEKEIIDYRWNERTNHICWERLELDHALSWLSTLGGAFSALGDYFPNAAQMAGKISHHQFKLALRLGDPNVQSRCRLFMSLSLIQQGSMEIARRIVETEYKQAKNSIVVDERLVKMCLGIWAKLQYEWSRKKNSEKNNNN